MAREGAEGRSAGGLPVDDGEGFYGTRGDAAVARRPDGMGLRLIDALRDQWHAEAGRVLASIRV